MILLLKSRIRKLFIRLSILLSILLVSFYILSESSAFKSWLKIQIIYQIENVLDVQVEISQLKGSIWKNPSLHEVQFIKKGKKLISIDELAIDYDFWLILKEKYQLNVLKIKGLSIQISKENGEYLIPEFISKNQNNTQKANAIPFEFSIKSIELEDIRIKDRVLKNKTVLKSEISGQLELNGDNYSLSDLEIKGDSYWGHQFSLDCPKIQFDSIDQRLWSEESILSEGGRDRLKVVFDYPFKEDLKGFVKINVLDFPLEYLRPYVKPLPGSKALNGIIYMDIISNVYNFELDLKCKVSKARLKSKFSSSNSFDSFQSIQISVKEDELSDWYSGLKGKFEGQINVKEFYSNLNYSGIDLDLRLKTFSYKDINFGEIKVSFRDEGEKGMFDLHQYQNESESHINGTIDLKNSYFTNYNLKLSNFNGSQYGDQFSDLNLDLEAVGSIRGLLDLNPEVTFELKKNEFRLKDLTFRNIKAFLKGNLSEVYLNGLSVQHELGDLKAKGEWKGANSNDINGEVEINNLHLNKWSSILPFKSKGDLSARALIQGDFDKTNVQTNFILSNYEDSEILMKNKVANIDVELKELNFLSAKGTIEAEGLSSKKIKEINNMNYTLELNADKKIQFSGNLNKGTETWADMNLKIDRAIDEIMFNDIERTLYDFRFKTKEMSCDFLRPYLPSSINELKGRMNCVLHFQHDGDKRHWNGNVYLKDGSFIWSYNNQAFSSISMDLSLNESTAKLETLTFNSKNGYADIKGECKLDQFMPVAWNVNLKLKDWPVYEEGHYSGLCQSELVWEKNNLKSKVEGVIRASNIEYLPQFNWSLNSPEPRDPTILVLDEPLRTEISLSPDVKESKPQAWWPDQVDIEVEIAQDSWIRHSLMEIEMFGKGKIESEEQRWPNLSGLFKVKRGWVTFLKKKFILGEESQVLFMGNPDWLPIIEIAGQADIKEHKIDVHLKSVEAAPLEVLRLTSEPELEEADILSLIIFGKIMDDLEEGEKTNMQDQMTTMVANQAAVKMASWLSKGLGLRDTRVEVLKADTQSIRLNVRRYLGQKLWLSISQSFGVGESEQEISLEYQIFRALKILTSYLENGETGIDLEWKQKY